MPNSDLSSFCSPSLFSINRLQHLPACRTSERCWNPTGPLRCAGTACPTDTSAARALGVRGGLAPLSASLRAGKSVVVHVLGPTGPAEPLCWGVGVHSADPAGLQRVGNTAGGQSLCPQPRGGSLLHLLLSAAPLVFSAERKNLWLKQLTFYVSLNHNCLVRSV